MDPVSEIKRLYFSASKASIQEDLSLDVTATPTQIADARRTMFAALRKALRDRGLAAPNLALASGNDKGKMVAL